MIRTFFVYGLLAATGLIGLPTATLAQNVVDQKTRFRFAQLHLGLDGQYIPPVQSGYLSATGKQRPLTLPGTYHPRFTIGATHFWGLADLYVSFPLTSIRPKVDQVQEYSVSTNVATGARVHPLQLRYHRLNPYLSVNWSTLSYNQRINEKLAGTTFTKDVGVQYLPARAFTYATSRQTTTPVRFSAFTAQISYKFLIDVTRPLEKNNRDAFGHYLRQHGKLSGFHLAIGPSAAFTLPRSDYNSRTRPYLNNPSGNSTFLDGLVVGWDIRPVRYESILLRANLRYSPFLKTQINGQTISFQQLEFNFIQAVIYPQRLLARVGGFIASYERDT